MRLPALVLACLITMLSLPLRAQDEAVRAETEADTAAVADSVYATSIAGEFTPGQGLRHRANLASQPQHQLLRAVPLHEPDARATRRSPTTWAGSAPVKARNDLNWHRTFVWLTGFFYVPRFRYNISLWSLPTTQQTLLFGNLQYRFSQALGVGVGIAPNLTARSVQGSWPFWGSSDRQMAEDFFRGGFSSGFFVTGQPLREILVHRLGQHQHQPARHHRRQRHARHGLQRERRLEAHHRRVRPPWRAGRLRVPHQGGHPVRRRRPATAANPATPRTSAPPNATQIKLSDGVNPFDAGALADGVTVQKLDYDVLAVDAGFKYRGFSFQSEYYVRKLSDFLATGPVPLESIVDQGLSGAGDAHGGAAPGRRLPHLRPGLRRLRPEPLGGVRRGELLSEPVPAAGG